MIPLKGYGILPAKHPNGTIEVGTQSTPKN